MILQNILNKAGGGLINGDWWRTQLLNELGEPNIDVDFSDTGGFAPGKMYFYQYGAITEKLPYYDKYPLTYVIRIEGDGFLGCNLHYVRLTQRDELAKSLLNNSAQGAVSVPRRTLHKYLYTGVKDIIFPIPEDEWSDVAQLPTEEFVDMRGIAVPRNKVYSKT
jgi:hypothetical protein